MWGETSRGTDPAAPLAPAHPPSVGVLVVLDNELIRRGLASMLQAVTPVARTWSCGDLDTALATLTRHRPDIVLCQADGATTAALVPAASADGARILLMLEDLTLDGVDETVLTHAQGFLLRDELTVASLQEAVRRLCAGDLPLPAGLARALLSRARAGGSTRVPREIALTPREQQVLGLLAQGLSNKQIARRLAISEHGVKRHVTNLLAKLNSPNRTLAVVVAMQENLI